MVALLTWVVMPLLTRVLHNWFYPEDKKHSP
jgi:antibiotic biosynthesis monooxygenase (ABM) superfamily enzyme